MIEPTLKHLVWVIVLVLVGWRFVSRRRRAAYLARLGPSPPLVPYRLPFGFDTLYEALRVSPPCTA
jgi:hypothetical protein